MSRHASLAFSPALLRFGSLEALICRTRHHPMDAQQYKDILFAIYPCKVPFTLALKDDKPKRRLGTYYGSSRRIILHTGWQARYDMVEVAIHEYAHHLHDSEFGGKEKRQAPHGKEFWQIYGQLMCRAKELGLCEDGKCPVLVFPRSQAVREEAFGNEEQPLQQSVRKAMRELLRSAYDWLNRE